MLRSCILFTTSLLFAFAAFSQNGTLLIGNPYISPFPFVRLDYPGPVAQTIDSLLIRDLTLGETHVLAAGDSLIAYDPQTWAAQTLLPAAGMYRVQQKDSLLLTLHDNPPYCRAWVNGQMTFALDTLHLNALPEDLFIDQQTAYLMMPRYFVRLDLLNQDTLSRVVTPHPFFWGPQSPGFNRLLIRRGRTCYFAVDYATGAPRFSLMRLDLDNLQVDTLHHEEFALLGGNMVLAGDRLYLGNFPSYYSLADDSLYRTDSLSSIPLAWDSAEQVMYVYVQSGEVRTWSGGAFTGSTPYTHSLYDCNGVLFLPDELNGKYQEIVGQGPILYPNPSQGDFYLRWNPKEQKLLRIKVYDLRGALILDRSLRAWQASEPILSSQELTGRGLYLLEILDERGNAWQYRITVP